uniref:Predicted protein n=1 Tax=Physcomitrium patens TaxID=3218 RepID=A9U6N2_PHYPA
MARNNSESHSASSDKYQQKKPRRKAHMFTYAEEEICGTRSGFEQTCSVLETYGKDAGDNGRKVNNLTKANYVRSESENRTKRVYPLSLPSRSLKLLREYCSKPQRWRETTTKRVRDATTESKRKRTPQGPTSQTMSPQTNLIPPTTEALKFTPRSVKNPHRPHNRSVEHPLIPGGRDTRTECRHSSHIVLKWDAAQASRVACLTRWSYSTSPLTRRVEEPTR